MHRVAREVIERTGIKVDYLVGTMIEVPRAAITADELAEVAEFFSFGTNDLTQTTLGLSRDDMGSFFETYRQQRDLRAQPVREHRRTGRRPPDHDRGRARSFDAAEHQARHLRRTRRRSGVDRVLSSRGARLRELFAAARADCASGGGASGVARRLSAASSRSSPASRICAFSRSAACRACSTTTPIRVRGPSRLTATNTTDLASIKLRQRVAVNMDRRTIATQMIGENVSMPVALAPVGLTGMQHADGEILAARSAEKFGVPYILSTMSICSIEDVAANTSRPFWFQLYVMRDRDYIGRLIDRAKAAGCSALVLTLDLQILGQRHKDLKNGLSTPPKPTLRNIANIATKPRWCCGHAATPTASVRQHRRPRNGHPGHEFAVGVDRAAVRSDAELGRRARGSKSGGAASSC